MKNVFLLMFVFAISLTLPLADATIGVVGGNAGISISGPLKPPLIYQLSDGIFAFVHVPMSDGSAHRAF